MFKYLKLIKAKYIFKAPSKNFYLIYDNESSYLCSLLKKNSYTIFFNRFEEINLYILFKCLFLYKGNSLSKRYALTYIRYVEPKIIISAIDNNLSFYKLHKYFKKIKIITVQNGIRSFQNDFKINKNLSNLKKMNLKCDYFFVLSEKYKKIYSKFIKSKYIVSGSIKSNKYKISTRHYNRIVFISQFSNNKKLFKTTFIEADKIAFTQTLNFCDKKNYKLYLLLKYGSKKEINFFKSLNKNNSKNLVFVSNETIKEKFRYLDNSNLIVAVDSTLGYEMIARKKKVFLISIRDQYLKNNEKRNIQFTDKNSSFKNEGFFWINNYLKKRKGLIFKKMDLLYNLPTKKINKVYNKYKQSLLIYDFKNTKIKRILR